MSKPSLKNFDKICNHLFSQQVTATIDGKPMEVKDDGNGNINISAELPAENDSMTQEQAQNIQSSEQQLNKINDLIAFLQLELEENIQAAKAAKTYAMHAKDDLPRVMYNQGYAEGKKHIIKYLIKELSGIINHE